MQDEEFITLIDVGIDGAALELAPWRVLVIDDDEEVHMATRYALRNAVILGRRLELFHTYSAAESAAILGKQRDFALILLDVVMEAPDAGLTLVKLIRQDCGMRECRIILRTGQPGFAPELPIIEAYEINDYRTKSELTQTRLLTAVTTALRSFDQIKRISDGEHGLKVVVDSASDFASVKRITGFAGLVMANLSRLLNIPGDGVFLLHRRHTTDDGRADHLDVVSAHGAFSKQQSLAAHKLLDEASSQLVSQAITERAHASERDSMAIHIADGEGAAIVYFRSHQALREVDRSLINVFAKNVEAYLAQLRLIEQLDRLAYVDALTGLGNRARYLADVARAVDQAEPSSLLLMDIRKFSDVNNGLGQDVGNSLLQVVASELRQCFSPNVQLARIGDDVFGAVGPLEEVDFALVLDRFVAPMLVGEHSLYISWSAGIYALEHHIGTAVDAFSRCNISLARAKETLCEGAVPFVPDMEVQVQTRLSLLHRLRLDAASGRLQLWYQPQVALKEDKVVAVEALMRWFGDTGSIVQQPEVFIPLAEQSDLIDKLGVWTLSQALSDWVQLREFGAAPLRVCINISVRQLSNVGFPTIVSEMLQRFGVPPDALELEVTESIATDDAQHVLETLHELRRTGMRIALDDFGTGYSSLARLSEMPIDCLKIDRSLVNMLNSPAGEGVVNAILGLARCMHLEVVAEGVETPAQLDFMRQQGCDLVQGWMFARAMPLADLRQWMASH